VEPGSVRLHHRGVGFLDRYGTGGFRAATFFATTPASREALDHRLFDRTASGVPKNPFSQQRVAPAPREGSELEAQREADRITLSKYGPAGVLVNADFEILQFRRARAANRHAQFLARLLAPNLHLFRRNLLKRNFHPIRILALLPDFAQKMRREFRRRRRV